ncbi:MAG: hypothetical protein FWE82_04005 [Defluviitaleaceae bacterium]|nr:hypothetical protein [Defluviitaleaceae bacterium]
MSWTKKDRVLAALSGEKPDRYPIFDYMINDALFAHYLGRSIVPGEQEAILRATSNCLDLCHPMPQAYEPKDEIFADGTRRVTERWMAWNIYPVRSRRQMKKYLTEEIERLEAGEHWLFADFAESWRKESEARHAWAQDMVYIDLGLWAPLLPGKNFEEEAMFLSDFKALCKRWNRLMNAAVLAMAEKRANVSPSPVAIIWNDIAMKGNLIYPPELLEEFFLPGLEEMISMLHSKNIKAVFHSDGNVTKILDRLADCGIDGFNPLEISAGMEASHFFEKYGKKVTLVGGMDAVGVLALGSPKNAAAAAKKLMREAEGCGRLILGSSSGQLDNSMPLENILAYFNAVWEN